jgi:hypothetical protein
MKKKLINFIFTKIDDFFFPSFLLDTFDKICGRNTPVWFLEEINCVFVGLKWKLRNSYSKPRALLTSRGFSLDSLITHCRKEFLGFDEKSNKYYFVLFGLINKIYYPLASGQRQTICM